MVFGPDQPGWCGRCNVPLSRASYQADTEEAPSNGVWMEYRVVDATWTLEPCGCRWTLSGGRAAREAWRRASVPFQVTPSGPGRCAGCGEPPTSCGLFTLVHEQQLDAGADDDVDHYQAPTDVGPGHYWLTREQGGPPGGVWLLRLWRSEGPRLDGAAGSFAYYPTEHPQGFAVVFPPPWVETPAEEARIGGAVRTWDRALTDEELNEEVSGVSGLGYPRGEITWEVSAEQAEQIARRAAGLVEELFERENAVPPNLSGGRAGYQYNPDDAGPFDVKPTYCWRCCATEVDAGDVIGLCPPCKAALKTKLGPS